MLRSKALTLSILFSMVILSAVLPACIEKLKEVVDPDLELVVVQVEERNRTEEGQRPISGHLWTFLLVNVTNNNKEGSVSMTPAQFYAKDENGDWLWCMGSEPDEEPEVAPGSTLQMSIYFMTEPSQRLVELEYRRTVSEPFSCPIPGPA